MNIWNRFSGILGMLALAFGLFGAFIFGRFTDPYTVVHLVVGAALLINWFLTTGARKTAEATQVISGRTVRYGVSALAYSAVFFVILVSLNWLAYRHNQRVDLTEEGVYSLSPQSAQLIQGLKAPLKLAFFEVQQDANGGGAEAVRDLFSLYKDKNPSKVTTEFINPRTKPQLLEQYGMRGDNLVYIQLGEGHEQAVTRLNQVTEDAITSAIAKLTKGAAKKIYFLQGHGEPGINDNTERGLKAFADLIKDEHLQMESIVLSQRQTVPQDAAAVVLIAPQTPLLPGEREALIKYVESGGRLLLMTNPREGADVRAIAQHFGISVKDDVVIDLVQRLLMGPTLATEFMSNSFGAHEITKGLTKDDIMVFNMSSSVVGGPSKTDVTYTELVTTSEAGWGESNLKGIFESDEPTAQKDGADLAGPVALGVAFERKTAAANTDTASDSSAVVSRVVVFGDSDWITNKYVQYSSHRDLLLNSLNWLAGEESGISIRPKKMRSSLEPISGEAFKTLLFSGFIIPELLLILGLTIWWRRRTLAV